MLIQVALKSFIRKNLQDYIILSKEKQQHEEIEEFNRTLSRYLRRHRRAGTIHIAWDFLENNYEQDCPVISGDIKPIRARNVMGDWRVLVQDVGLVSQVERVSICLRPEQPCQQGAGNLPCYRSYCRQLTSARNLLAFDPCDPHRGIFVDRFKFPSECSCLLSVVPC